MKANITTIPTVSATGTQLKFAWILAAKTDRITKSLKLPRSIATLRSLSGWTTSETMIDYFDRVLLPFTNRQPCALLLDSFAAHWTVDVRKAAFDRKIELIEIPKGTTGEIQPLDVSFNAQYKRNRQQILRDSIANHELNLEERKQVVLRCAKAASNVTRKIILAGWKPLLN